MLTGSCFGNDPLLSHAPGEQDLAEGVVDLVGAGVEQVLALEVDFGAAEFLGEAFSKIERGGPTDEFLEQGGEFVPEGWILAGGLVFPLEFEQCGHQGLGHKAPPVRTEVAVLIR